MSGKPSGPNHGPRRPYYYLRVLGLCSAMGDDPNTGNVSKWQAAGAAPRAIGSMDGNPGHSECPGRQRRHGDRSGAEICREECRALSRCWLFLAVMFFPAELEVGQRSFADRPRRSLAVVSFQEKAGRYTTLVVYWMLTPYFVRGSS